MQLRYVTLLGPNAVQASPAKLNSLSPTRLLRRQCKPPSKDVKTATVNQASGRVKAIEAATRWLGSAGLALTQGSTCGRAGASPLTRILFPTTIEDTVCAGVIETPTSVDSTTRNFRGSFF